MRRVIWIATKDNVRARVIATGFPQTRTIDQSSYDLLSRGRVTVDDVLCEDVIVDRESVKKGIINNLKLDAIETNRWPMVWMGLYWTVPLACSWGMIRHYENQVNRGRIIRESDVHRLSVRIPLLGLIFVGVNMVILMCLETRDIENQMKKISRAHGETVLAVSMTACFGLTGLIGWWSTKSRRHAY